MTLVVINACHGGFSLSMDGERAYLARKGKTPYFYVNLRDENGRLDFDKYVRAEAGTRHFVVHTLTEDLGDSPNGDELEASEAWFDDRAIARNDPDLIAVVRELGHAADGAHANLEVIEIPDGVEWEIEEYDGLEWVAEKHRTWQ